MDWPLVRSVRLLTGELVRPRDCNLQPPSYRWLQLRHLPFIICPDSSDSSDFSL